MVIDEMLTSGHVRTLLSLDDQELQYQTAMRIFDEKLSVRETERLIKNLLNPKPQQEKKELQNKAIYQQLEERMKEVLGAKVSINRKSEHKGRIEIEYYSDEELERIMDLINSCRQ